MSLVNGDRCWKTGRIQKQKIGKQHRADVCSRQLAIALQLRHAPYVQTGLLRGEASNIPNGYQKPKQLFGNGQERSMEFSLRQGRAAILSSEEEPI